MASYHHDYNSPPRIGERARLNKYTDQIQQFERQIPRIFADEPEKEEDLKSTMGAGNQPSQYIDEASNGYAYGMTRREFLTASRQQKESLERQESSRPTISVPAKELKPRHTRNVLRRKPSTIAQHAAATHPERTESVPPVPQMQNIPRYARSNSAPNQNQPILGPWKPRKDSKDQAIPTVIPELDRYRSRTEPVKTPAQKAAPALLHKISTQDLPPPTPSFWNGSGHSRNSGCSGYSASLVTRYSESPGPGPYSRDTTPSSILSQSPGMSIPMKTNSRSLQQVSPTHGRPPLANARFRIASDDETSLVKEDSPRKGPLLSSAQVNSRKENSSKRQKLGNPPTPPTRASSNNFSGPGKELMDSPSMNSHPAHISQANSTSTIRASPAITSVQTRSKTTPPVRPSREGAPDLMIALGDSIVAIRDNLASLDQQVAQSMETLPRSSAPSPAPSTSSQRPVFRSRLPSRTRTPSPAIQRQPTPALNTTTPKPEVASISRRVSIRSPSPTTTITTKSRFGLFGKKSKSDNTQEKAKLRKGPAAGTGHEGYGRYALHRGTRSDSTGPVQKNVGDIGRRRSGILTSGVMSPSASSSSVISPSSTTSVQDEFLKSRMSPVVMRGGEVVKNRNAGAEIAPRPSLDSVMSPSQVSLASGGSDRTTMWPNVPPKAIESAPTATPPTKPKRLSKLENKKEEIKQSLAVRRSLTRLHTSSTESNLPQTVTNLRYLSPAISSNGSIRSTKPKADKVSATEGVSRFKARKLESEEKKKKPRKWNFFARAQGAGKKEELVVSLEERTVAHYAMMDFDEQADKEKELGIEDIMREVMEADREAEKEVEKAEEPSTPAESPKEFTETATPPAPMIQPFPSQLPSESPTRPVPSRPSRLAQVGRIPQVVTRADRNSGYFSQPSPHSFQTTVPESVALGPNSIAEPKFIGQDGQEIPGSLGEPSSSSGDGPLSREQSNASFHVSRLSQQEFFRTNMRQGSQVTTSTSSTGRSFEGTTAIIPYEGMELMEDEVWDEYDDLLVDQGMPNACLSNEESFIAEDEVEVPSATSSHGQPFRFEGYGELNKDDDSTVGEIRIGLFDDDTLCQQEISHPQRNDGQAPDTPLSFTDFISGYGDRNSIISKHSTSPSTSNNSSRLSSISEQMNTSPLAQVNLRVGSMHVSKWLTFGHVLFSPVRDTIPTKSSKEEFRVLVVDGLGNDDWSFYASETYPSATFHNLSRSPTTSAAPSAYLPTSPPNHHQSQHLSLSDPFPFAPSYFNAIILRFPPSSSPQTYRTLVTEAKRTLKPGGYLEMSILDLDMHDMGPQTRRAMRDLKVRLAGMGRDLAPTGDNIMRLVGEVGMEGVKSCVVGMPVAPSISRRKSVGGARRSSMGAGSRRVSAVEESLVEMMRDSSKAGEEGILRCVGKVGRWWWTRVYDGRGVWGERGVLKECEEWGTGFKLLVAFARKPARERGQSL